MTDMKPHIAVYLAGIAAAAFGGIAKLVQEWMTANGSGTPFPWKMLFAKIVVSAFVGFCFLEISLLTKPQFAYIACAIAGWMGGESIDWLKSVLQSRIKRDRDT